MKKGNEIVRLFNNQINGSDIIKMNGKVYFMMIDRLTKVKRHTNVKSNIHTKKCMNCGVEKSVNYFYTDSSSMDNYHIRCKSCCDSINVRYR